MSSVHITREVLNINNCTSNELDSGYQGSSVPWTVAVQRAVLAAMPPAVLAANFFVLSPAQRRHLEMLPQSPTLSCATAGIVKALQLHLYKGYTINKLILRSIKLNFKTAGHCTSSRLSTQKYVSDVT